MKKILIADDEPGVLQLCSAILEKEKYIVATIGHGSGLLERVRNEKPDLLILDVMLPGIDGYTLQLQISHDPVLSHIPVIVISALNPAAKLFNEFSQVKGFLSKPFQPDELIQMVNKALNS